MDKDEELIERFEKEEREMLLKYYNLQKGDKECPSNAYLLSPDRLQLTSYETKPNGVMQLNVGYKTHWSGYVTETLRITYDQVVLGTIFCEGVEKYSESSPRKVGTIKIPFLSKMKIVNLPINNTHNIEIRCRNLKVDSIDIYVEHDGVMITNEEYITELRVRLKNGL